MRAILLGEMRHHSVCLWVGSSGPLRPDGRCYRSRAWRAPTGGNSSLCRDTGVELGRISCRSVPRRANEDPSATTVFSHRKARTNEFNPTATKTHALIVRPFRGLFIPPGFFYSLAV